MKYTIQTIALLLLFQNSYAQYADRIQFNAGNFVVPQKEGWDMFTYTFVRQMGISYTHHFKNRLSLHASHTQWLNIQNIGSGYFFDGYHEPRQQPQDLRLGDIETRQNYKSIDVNCVYSLVAGKRHQLYSGAGISYTWGWYTYYTGIYNHPGYPDWLLRVEGKNHQDIGVSAEIGYNYLMARQRINLGISETVRTYTTLPFQFYTNINIGYNFNWGFLKKNTKTKP